ncbi:MAG: hypothetical protein HY825_01950 [Acidobacteria bacterium]|nr:hypothetical protein [Acidobacteriota bacterium]
MVFHITALSVETIAAGTSVGIALEGGTIIDAPTVVEASPVRGGNGGYQYTLWTVDVGLTAEQVKQLASATALAVRTQAAGLSIQMSIDEDPAARLRTLAICLAGDFSKGAT